ncbi:MAG TPA: hypothetical protein VFA75_06215 [Nevskia sp.]|nr:hypothetical protein [Nevskia sp.]
MHDIGTLAAPATDAMPRQAQAGSRSGVATQAWVLHDLSRGNRPRDLRLESLHLAALEGHELLVEPLYGCWEGNMSHAVSRQPIDIARQRGEDRVVIGNAGVVRVLRPGADVTGFKEGDVCLWTAVVWDKHGFTHRVAGYDAPGTVGLLARRTKVRQDQLIRVPVQSRFGLAQWAAFAVRHITAWGNWRVAMQCYSAMRPSTPGFEPWVWGWGGGTAFAELTLAARQGFRTALIASEPSRLERIRKAGIVPVDRRRFAGLDHRRSTDPSSAGDYRQAEHDFLTAVDEVTDGQRVSIFVDHLGAAVTPATLKALARPGVITTSGWKTGMDMKTNRAVASMNWHVHVHSHYARRDDCAAAVAYAEESGWIPELDSRIYDWDEIPQLARDYAEGGLGTYFPIYRVNPE